MGIRDIYYVDEFYASFQLFPFRSACWLVYTRVAGPLLANGHSGWHDWSNANQSKRHSEGSWSWQIGNRYKWHWLRFIVWLFITGGSGFLPPNFKGLYRLYAPLRYRPVLTGSTPLPHRASALTGTPCIDIFDGGAS